MEKMKFCVILFFMNTDKRQFYRHPIKVPIQLMKTDEHNTTATHAEDLSQGGLSFYWPNMLSEGSQVCLSIPVEKQLFKMNARVAYARKDETMALFKIGVCFEDAVSAFRAKLAEEIIQIRQYRERMSSLRGRALSEEEAAQLWIDRNAEDFAKLIPAVS